MLTKSRLGLIFLLIGLFSKTNTYAAVGCLRTSAPFSSTVNINDKIFTGYIGTTTLLLGTYPNYNEPSYYQQGSTTANAAGCGSTSIILGAPTGEYCAVDGVRYNMYNYTFATPCDVDTYALLSTLFIGTIGAFAIKKKRS